MVKSQRRNIKSGKLGVYYKGGFEGKMSKKEASLILGAPMSSSDAEVRERHKKMMIINHPDAGKIIGNIKSYEYYLGGSTFVSSKINEARDVFLRGGMF